MAKKVQYFSHDYSARRDPKIVELQRALGMEGYGIWWALIEIMYEQGGKYPVTGLEGLAYEFRVDVQKVCSVVYDFGLFERTDDGEYFYNASILRRLGHEDEISRKRSEAGRVGGLTTRQGEGIPKMVLAMIVERVPNSDRGAIMGYDDQRELERIFGVFYFDRNCAEAGVELARFITNYRAQGWIRNGEQIADRVALARAWKLKSTKKVTEAPGALAYIKAVYIQALANGRDDRWRLVREISCMMQDSTALTFWTTDEVQGIIAQMAIPCKYEIKYEKEVSEGT